MKPKKLFYGVGINDADYVVEKLETLGYVDGKQKQKLVWLCPYYRVWRDMLKRCYSAKYQENRPALVGCAVSDDWLTFSNFKTWMEKQGWQGNQLDKDLLVRGNKIYSAETCVFVTPIVNTFTHDPRASRGEFQIGASWHKASKMFCSNCNNPFTKKQESLGYFDCEQQAHEAWLKRKLELAHLLASEQTDERVAKALILKYTNYKASMAE